MITAEEARRLAEFRGGVAVTSFEIIEEAARRGQFEVHTLVKVPTNEERAELQEKALQIIRDKGFTVEVKQGPQNRTSEWIIRW